MQRRCPPLWYRNKSPRTKSEGLFGDCPSWGLPRSINQFAGDRRWKLWLVSGLCVVGIVILMVFRSSPVVLSPTLFPVEELPQFPDTVFIGHRACDTDSLGASLGAAALFGSPHVAVCEEGLTPETMFVANHFGLRNLLPSTSPQFVNKTWGLVDHNELAQVQQSVKLPAIVIIIDHHVVTSGTVPLSGPTRMDIRPWGSGSTIVCYKFFEAQLHVPQGEVAGSMLAGIISDTFNLAGPTTTRFDRVARDYLAQRAGVEDVDDFAYKLFQAKSDVSALPVERVIQLDAKQFTMSGRKVWIGVQETVDPHFSSPKLHRYVSALCTLKKQLEVEYMIFVVVSILEQSSFVVVADDPEAALLLRCFGGALGKDEHVFPTHSRVSRKLDFVPLLQACLAPK